jgi:hypothetical protein
MRTWQRWTNAAWLAVALISAPSATWGREVPPPASGPVGGLKAASTVTVVWNPGEEGVAARRQMAEVRGLDAGALAVIAEQLKAGVPWQRFLAVSAESGDDLSIDPLMPSLAGTYAWIEGGVRFVPAFPPSPGVRYRAVLRREAFPPGAIPEGAIVTAIHREPASTLPPTTVVSRIAPSSKVVPENLLKFYVHFSAPMSRGHIYDHIHLRTAKGEVVELPFLEIDEELWNPAMTRLTLFLDPGRIKRGVKPLEEVGPSLEEGHRYTLVLDRGWRDAMGQPLKAGFEKVFEVGPPDREAPDLKRWAIHAPHAGGREALTVTFPEPMDDALTRRVLRVVGDGVQVPEGRVELASEERQWLFIPDSPWEAGSHQLLIGGTLEDLAGNNPGKPFEVDLFEGVQRRLTNETIRLPFVIR